MDTNKIKENLIVYAKGEGETSGSPGVHIGTVEHMDGEKYVKLSKSDSLDGHYHWFPVDWVAGVDEKAMYLNKTKSEIMEGLMVYHCKPASN